MIFFWAPGAFTVYLCGFLGVCQRRRSITVRIIGTPMMAVKALIGIMVLSGIVLTTLQPNATTAPVSIVAGISTQ